MNYEGYLIDKSNNRVIPNQDFFKRVGSFNTNSNYTIPSITWHNIKYNNNIIDNAFINFTADGRILINKKGLYLFNVEYDFGANITEGSDIIYKASVNDIEKVRDICNHGTRAGRNLCFILDLNNLDVVSLEIYNDSANAYPIAQNYNWLNVYYIR